MIFKNYLTFLLVIISFSIFSQVEESIFSVDGESVSTSEFLKVYNKNSHIVVDDSQKGIENYLELYVNYKLKVKQARELGYDTLPAYKRELKTYKKQLMAPYLKDDEFVSKLVKEAYERSLIEKRASHILVKLSPLVKDTIPAYTKINKARIEILNGLSFKEVAKQYSDDESVQQNDGDLGYFSVFDMVYLFENAVYNAKLGEVSNVFKTRFGYHIVMVHDTRNAMGEVEVAHIMIQNDSISSKEKIDLIYKEVLKGEESFELIARKNSDDKYSAEKGGSLGRFGAGKMVSEFETVSFGLKNEGDISEPFKTQFGWHIVKLIKKFPVENFEEQEKELIGKVKRGDRASIVSNSIVHKIKNEYEVIVNSEALKPFENNTWKTIELSNELLTIREMKVSQNELETFLGDKGFSILLFEKFKEYQILEYYKAHLEETNLEFAEIYKEYKEGLLLFELLQKKIWDKSKDSIGIKNYYDNNSSTYALKDFENIKGQVSNDYQNYLEEEWIKELHNTYKVIINDEVVQKLIEKMK